ncbi:MAG: aminotransferase class V-fold PLP-dependent enzyme, partial [Deltaproteobacteria bacterium]|nr:aminotransferase class V-fold PLP-dependent enzyme [Deltaproteobacteria bacterium]
RPEEIALLENATRAWDAVFYGMRFERGDRILTGRAEYCSNYMAYLDVAERTGAEIVVIDDDEHGQVDVARRPVASSSGRRAAPGCSSSRGRAWSCCGRRWSRSGAASGPARADTRSSRARGASRPGRSASRCSSGSDARSSTRSSWA